MNYAVEVTTYIVLDGRRDERLWRGTISNGEVTYLFEQKDDERHDVKLPNRLMLFTLLPGNKRRRVYWSTNITRSDRAVIKEAVNSAINTACEIADPVFKAQNYPARADLVINRDSIVFMDEHSTITYPRREDGTVDPAVYAEAETSWTEVNSKEIA